MAILELQTENSYQNFLEDTTDEGVHNSCPDNTSQKKRTLPEPKKVKHHTLPAMPSASGKFKFTPPVNVWNEFLPFFEQLDAFKEGNNGKQRKQKKGKRGKSTAESRTLLLETFCFMCLNYPLGKKTRLEFQKLHTAAARLISPHEILVDLISASAFCHHIHKCPVTAYCKAFEEGKRLERCLSSKDFLTCDDFTGHGIQAWALSSLHLYLCERSPLSFGVVQFENFQYVAH